MKYFFVLAFVYLLVNACANAPQSDTAQVQDNLLVVAEKLQAAQLSIDLPASKITWIGTKPTGKHNGFFALDSGVLAVEGDKIVGGYFRIDMNKTEALDNATINNAKLTQHLKSDDFFATQRYPTAIFELISVETFTNATNETDDDNNLKIDDPTHTITGNLTLKDSTKTISFPARVLFDNGTVAAKANFNIDRTQWGITYKAEGSLPDKFIHNTVNIGIDLKTKK